MSEQPFDPLLPPADDLDGVNPTADTPAPNPVIDEPPLEEEDTRPRPPVVLAEENPAFVQAWLAADEPPIDPHADTAEVPLPRSTARPVLVGVVMAATICLCLALVGLAGFAGYRDGLATNDARITQTLATGIAQQYATGVADLQQGYAELAAARFSWIVETIQAPTQYALDSRLQLAMAKTIAAYTPTPSPTILPTATATLTPMPTEPPIPTVEPSATLDALLDPAYLYQQAQVSMGVMRYEEAIEWLDALIALDPTHRPSEVKPMLVEALFKQGAIYLNQQNEDGADMLARGVLLVYRANDLAPGEEPTIYGGAIFAEMYINARNYVNGGYYSEALPILQDLCSINCGWSYHQVSVQNLLDQAQNGTTP
ncbi:MAG: hypothetical protein HY866_06280 [Chloroflexi bacterium]|nr:hypothetical protein [Chloroflexota bacterium]